MSRRNEPKLEAPIERRWIDEEGTQRPPSPVADLIKAAIRTEPLSHAQLESVTRRLARPSPLRALRLRPSLLGFGAVTVVAGWLAAHDLGMRERSPGTRAPEPRRSADVAAPPPRAILEAPPIAPLVPPPKLAAAPRAPKRPRPAVVGRDEGQEEGTLDAQATFIGDGLRLLRAGHDADGAVRLLSDFDRRFPGGELAPEAHAALEEALLANRSQPRMP
jgi:hypothetical protein